MKKQINPTIKAHLVRGAFYLLLFLAVCAIPLALGQRANNGQRANKQSPTVDRSQLPPLSTVARGGQTARIPALPASQLPYNVQVEGPDSKTYSNTSAASDSTPAPESVIGGCEPTVIPGG
jgi:hypothetical protein